MKRFLKTLSVFLVVLLACFATVSTVGAANGDEVALPAPVIYGDFNTWVIEGTGSCPLTETGTGTGIFKGIYSFDAYTADGDGYSLFTCITKIDYDPYGWGAGEQYKMNGEAAGFGATSFFKPDVTGKYEFTYTAETHVTTAVLYEVNLATPVIYGDFNSWAIEGENARPLTETGTDTGIFKGTYAFDAYTGTSDGYALFTCISKINYGVYGWGAGLQYKMNGEVAGFGATSFFKPTVTGNYEVTYLAETHVTTLALIVLPTPTPTPTTIPTSSPTPTTENVPTGDSPGTSGTGALFLAISILGIAAVAFKSKRVNQ